MSGLQPTLCLALAILQVGSAAATPEVIAHRGASHAAPENTRAAFELAWKQGADGIEGDFRLTADGRIVCIHDEHTGRVASRKRVVARSTWDELAQLDVGSWKGPEFAGERIPLLTDLLARLPAGKWFFIEIKCGPEIIPPLARVLAGADPKRIVLLSFNQQTVAAARKAMPGVDVHLVSKLKRIHWASVAKRERRRLGELDVAGLQFKHSARVKPAWIDGLQDEGYKIAAWTVDEAGDVRRMKALGVDFITTNRPAETRRLLSGE